MGNEQSAIRDRRGGKKKIVEPASNTSVKAPSDGVNTTDGPHKDFQYTKDVCALSYWEPIRLLGEGSISDIHLVVRRDAPIQVKYKEKRDVMALAKKNKNNDDSKKMLEEELREVCALKSIMKDLVRNERILEEMRREIFTMSHLRHPYIVKVIEAYERRRHIYLVMEYCSGGDLTDRTFSEPDCAIIVAKVLLALSYMHSHGVVHRDIKLENIVFASNGEPKIIDFGLATKYLSQEYKNMTDKVGTLYSMAPQVLQGVYDSKCDVWSVGVVTYCLLSGYKPFWGPPIAMPWPERRKIMINRIMRCQYMKMKGPTWSKISPEGRKFVASLLKLDPTKRPSAQQALDESPWLQRHAHDLIAAQSNENSHSINGDVDATSSSFRSSSELIKKESEAHDRRIEIRCKVQDILVTGLNSEELQCLQRHVEANDEEGMGRVSLDELHRMLVSLDTATVSSSGTNSAPAPRDWSKLFGRKNSKHQSTLPAAPMQASIQSVAKRFDKLIEDSDQETATNPKTKERTKNKDVSTTTSASQLTIEYQDFFARALEQQGRLVIEAIAKACDDLDVQGTRKVPWAELQPAMKQAFPSDHYERLVEQIKVDNKGLVSTIQVLEVSGVRVARQTRNSIRSAHELGEKETKKNRLNDDDEDAVTDDQDLVNEMNAVIPGGKTYDASSKELKFMYDAAQESFRRKN